MPEPGAPVAPASPVERAAAYALLLVLTVELAVWGAFLVPLRVGDQLVPASWLIAVAGNLAIGWAGGRLGGRVGAAVPSLLWLGLALVLSARRDEGDLVVPGSVAGIVFLCAGALTSAVVCSVTPLRRAGPAAAAAHR